MVRVTDITEHQPHITITARDVVVGYLWRFPGRFQKTQYHFYN